MARVIVAFGITRHTGIRLAEIGFLLVLFAGIWLAAAQMPQLKFASGRTIVAGVALAQLRTVAQCMREHGISDFPDPRSTRPSDLSLGRHSEITDYEGVFLLFPATIDMQSPAWEQAAAACGTLAESFDHPHH